MLKKLLTIANLILLATAVSMKADTIGPGASCGSCMGSSYTLTYSSLGGNQYDVLLSINTSGFTGGAGSFLNSVSLKLTPQSSDITGLFVVQQPATFAAPIAGGINANGCSGAGNGFFCTESSGNGVAVGGTYNFEYRFTTTSLLLGTGADSVKALYVDSTGKQNGITSEAISLSPAAVTPEPSSLVLLATGLFGAAGAMRRRFKA